MNKERLNLLENYIKSEVSPLLVQNIPSNSFNNSVIIKSNIDRSELNGHYENTDFYEFHGAVIFHKKCGKRIELPAFVFC